MYYNVKDPGKHYTHKNVNINVTKNATTGQVSGSIIATVTKPGIGGTYNLLVKGLLATIQFDLVARQLQPGRPANQTMR
jgi:hypothetical protein